MMFAPPHTHQSFQASVRIERPVGEVFQFYRDQTNLPSFMGDVVAVERASPDEFRWTIQLPLRIKTHWIVKLTEERANSLISFQTVGTPGLATRWEVRFTPIGRDATDIHELMTTPLGTPGCIALAMIGKFPALEVRANLHRLKQVLETGKVTDTSYSVRDKFSGTKVV